MDAMERLMAGRTTFMIAHRLSTLESATCASRSTRARSPTRPGDGAALPVSTHGAGGYA